EVGEQADAVCRAGNRVEVVLDHAPGQVDEDVLAHVVGGLDVEAEAGDDAEGTERHDAAVEVRLAPDDAGDRPVGGHQLDPRDGCGQGAGRVARAVGAG